MDRKSTATQSNKEEMHFRVVISTKDISGKWFPSIKDGSFVVIWGHSNNCFAYLHDFDSESQKTLINECKRCIDHPYKKNDGQIYVG